MNRISVVIPMLNEQSNIGVLLDALDKQTLPPDEIIVVDGNSTDASIVIASNFSSVKLIRSNPPVGAQRQKGLEAASGDIVVFLDCDAVPARNFLEKALEDFRRKNAHAACPTFVPYNAGVLAAMVFLFYNSVFKLCQSVLPSGGGMCIIVKRREALEMGGFRTDLVYEDIEFIRRIGKKLRFRILPTKLQVSARRFRRQGIVLTSLQYLALSFFFIFGLFKAAEIVPYRFGGYDPADEEKVVLVDDHGKSVGYELKKNVHRRKTPLHLAFSVFLFNSSGKTLLQQRSALKKTWPLAWSNSCCGHPLPGETVEQAARRRLWEELGIKDAALKTAIPDFRYCAQKDGVQENELCPVLIGFTDSEPNIDPSEVNAVKYVDWEELEAMCNDPHSELSPWCIEEVKLLSKLKPQPFFHQTHSRKP